MLEKYTHINDLTRNHVLASIAPPLLPHVVDVEDPLCGEAALRDMSTSCTLKRVSNFFKCKQ